MRSVVPHPFRCRKEAERFIFENEYVSCIHDAAAAGGIASTVLKNGSGRNLFSGVQSFRIGLIENYSYHVYTAAHGVGRLTEIAGDPGFECRSGFFDAAKRQLAGVELVLSCRYTQWGEALCRAALIVSRRIDGLGTVEIGSFRVSRAMEKVGLLCNQAENWTPYAGNCIREWLDLIPGALPLYRSRHLPLSMIFLRRGVEGMQFTLGDDLAPWENFGGALPASQMSFVSYSSARDDFGIRVAALDCLKKGQYLAPGEHVFEFSFAFPFVGKKVPPLVPCAGNIIRFERDFARRLSDDAELAALEAAGTPLMRFHNDADSFDNGKFWRDGVYPPYPAKEMAELDDLIARMHRHHIGIVPYFSLHELHPEAPEFAAHGGDWSRQVVCGDEPIVTAAAGKIFGCQMCLKSQWFKKRCDSIAEVLDKHDFDGLYYDWCGGLECVNPAHGNGRHWDCRKMMELLEWSRALLGAEKPLWLHLTGVPNIAAENLATVVLAEEAGGSLIAPEMFSPQAHFLPVASRQVCEMLPADAPTAVRRRYALCALLHHATLSAMHRPLAEFYAEYRSVMRTSAEFAHHTAPGEGLVSVPQRDAGASAYWNDDGKAVIWLANLSSEPQDIEWHFTCRGEERAGRKSVPPLALDVQGIVM